MDCRKNWISYSNRFGSKYLRNNTLLDTMPSAITIEGWVKPLDTTSVKEIYRKVNASGNRL